MNQLAALLQQSQVPSQGVPSQGEQTPKTAYDEYLLRHQQENSHQALAAALSAAAAQQQQLPGRLSTQNSSNSLLGGLPSSGFDSPTSINHPIATTSQASLESTMITSSSTNSSSVAPQMQSASRQASSDRLLNMNSAESVQDHITRLINENEAIVEPNPVLLKRRPYHRQSTSNSITSQKSDIDGRE